MLSYRRENALQKWKTGTGRQYFTDLIGLRPLLHNWPAKLSNSVKKTQNKGHYAVQGHSKSSRSLPIERGYAMRLPISD